MGCAQGPGCQPAGRGAGKGRTRSQGVSTETQGELGTGRGQLCPAAETSAPPSFSPAADIISTVEFNHTGELLATGDKGGRVVIFQREPEVCEARGLSRSNLCQVGVGLRSLNLERRA